MTEPQTAAVSREHAPDCFAPMGHTGPCLDQLAHPLTTRQLPERRKGGHSEFCEWAMYSENGRKANRRSTPDRRRAEPSATGLPNSSSDLGQISASAGAAPTSGRGEPRASELLWPEYKDGKAYLHLTLRGFGDFVLREYDTVAGAEQDAVYIAAIIERWHQEKLAASTPPRAPADEHGINILA